jgi:hypothetical protein
VSRAVGALASLEVAEGAPSEGLRLPLLGELLAATADTLTALAGGDLRAARGPGGALGALAEGDLRVARGGAGRGLLDGFLEGPPAFACGTACEPGASDFCGGWVHGFLVWRTETHTHREREREREREKEKERERERERERGRARERGERGVRKTHGRSPDFMSMVSVMKSSR